MSYARMYQTFPSSNAANVEEQELAHVPFVLDKEFRKKIKKNDPNQKIRKLLLRHSRVRIDEFRHTFETARKLCKKKKLSDEQKALAEEYKHQMMKAFYRMLAGKENKKKNKPDTDTWPRRMLVYFLTACGLALDAAGNFLFANTLLGLIPGIGSTLLTIGALALTVISSALFYAFEASMLRKAFGVREDDEPKDVIFNATKKQIALTKDINNTLLINAKNISTADYRQYTKLALLMNDDLQFKKDDLEKPKESIWKKALKYTIIGFGAVMEVAGAYFYVTELLPVIAPALVGTGAAFLIGAFAGLIALAFFASMRASGMMNADNDAGEQFKELKKKFKKFEPANDELELALAEKEQQRQYPSNNRKMKQITQPATRTDSSDDLEYSSSSELVVSLAR